MQKLVTILEFKKLFYSFRNGVCSKELLEVELLYVGKYWFIYISKVCARFTWKNSVLLTSNVLNPRRLSFGEADSVELCLH